MPEEILIDAVTASEEKQGKSDQGGKNENSLIPVSLVTWLASRRGGIVASLASTFVSLVADVAGGHTNSQLGIYLWNTLIIFSTFVTFALLFSALRRALDHERDLAHIDFLTGAVNSRFFFDLVNMEIYRSQRNAR